MNTYHKHVVVAVFAAFVVSACSSSPEVVPSSGPRSATSPEQVEIYAKAPDKYEVLGNVTVTGAEGAKWDERGDATEGFEALKRKAAARGANGLLLKVGEGDYDQLVLAGYKGEYYQVPVKGNPPTAVVEAIYVLEK